MTEYGKMLIGNATIRVLKKRAENGTISSKEMNRLVEEYGEVAGKCIAQLVRKEFPGGKIPETDVRRIVSPILRQCQKLVAEAVNIRLDLQYAKAGVGLKATIPEYNTKMEDELVKEISMRSFEDGFA